VKRLVAVLFVAGCGVESEPLEVDVRERPECEGRLELLIPSDVIVTSLQPHRSPHLLPEIQEQVLEYTCVLPPEFEPGPGGPDSQNPPTPEPDDGLVRVGVNGRCHRVAPGHLVPRGTRWPGPWSIETECPAGFEFPGRR
jgi:hypothetical protein